MKDGHNICNVQIVFIEKKHYVGVPEKLWWKPKSEKLHWYQCYYLLDLITIAAILSTIYNIMFDVFGSQATISRVSEDPTICTKIIKLVQIIFSPVENDINLVFNFKKNHDYLELYPQYNV